MIKRTKIKQGTADWSIIFNKNMTEELQKKINTLLSDYKVNSIKELQELKNPPTSMVLGHMYGITCQVCGCYITLRQIKYCLKNNLEIKCYDCQTNNNLQ